MEVAGQKVIKITALVVKPVKMSDTSMVLSPCGVVLVSYYHPSDSPFPQEGERAEHEDRDGPEPDRVLIGSYVIIVPPDKGQVPEHPVKHPIRISPYPCRVRNFLRKTAKGVQGGIPVASGLINKYGMHLIAHLIQQAEAQQAVLSPAGEDGIAGAVHFPIPFISPVTLTLLTPGDLLARE